MADRRQIEGMIEKKEQEIQELEVSIKDARIYLQALKDVLKKFPKASPSEEAATSLRPGSIVALARENILSARKPLHVDEMLRMQGKELTRDNRTALGGSLSAYVRKGSIFTRSAPNTFGLVELEHQTAPEEPPPDFGSDRSGKAALDDDIPF